MRSAELPFLADWFAIALRWLALLGLIIALALSGSLTTPMAVILFAGVIWNLFVSFLALLNQRLPAHRLINLAADIILALAIFIITGGVAGAVSWVGLLAIFTTSLYYEAAGSLVVGVILCLVEGGWTYWQTPELFFSIPMALTAALNLVSSVGLGLLGSKLVAALRQIYHQQVSTRRQGEERAAILERERMQAFFALTSTLSTTLNYENVLNEVLNLGGQVVGEEQGDKLVSAILLFEGDSLVVKQSRGMTTADQRVILPGADGILQKAIDAPEPVITERPSDDPELRRLISLHPCQSVVCLSMRWGINVFGLVLFAHPERGFFTPDRCQALELISRQAVVAIQNAQLYESLAKEKERLIESQEEARKKLARDLHDGPTQSVAAIAMRVNLARQLIQNDPKATDEELGRIEELAHRTTKEIRHMLFTLRPLILESQGLTAALNAMAEKMKETYDQNMRIDVSQAVVNQLEIGRQTVIFFIVEEAVNNARKYAQASAINVSLRLVSKEKEIALLEIQDNGVGFDMKSVMSSYDNRSSLGMVNLQERSELINGLLNFETKPGVGTRVQVFIPLSESAADLLHRTP